MGKDQDYFHEPEQLSLLSKLRVYPDYIHRIWTDNPRALSKNEFIQKYKSIYNILIEDINNFPSPMSKDKVKWGVNHEDPKRGLAYLSDWYRFHILQIHGGVYSDLDCYSLRRYPFDYMMGCPRYVNAGNLRTVEGRILCIIGTQTSHRYKGTSIHFIAAEPDAPFINEYMKVRNQLLTGSAQCGFKALEDLKVYATTAVYPETVFSHTIQDDLIEKFTTCSEKEDILSQEFIHQFCKEAYELHLPGPEGKYLLSKPWMMDFLRALVNSRDQNYF